MNTYEVRPVGDTNPNNIFFIFGYSWKGACHKANINPEDYVCIRTEREDDSAWQ